MHLILALRGQKHAIEQWIEDLEAQYFPLKLKDANLVHGNKEEVEKNIKAGIPSYLQLIVRPVQLCEITFPKEHRDELLKTIFGTNSHLNNNLFGKITAILRKLVGLKDVEPFNEASQYRLIRKGISVYPIGIKEDKEIDGQEYV